MLTYNECKSLFLGARTCSRIGQKAVKIDNNTYLVPTDRGFGVRLHKTVVVDIAPDDTYLLNNGGWFTNTTKDRINRFSPVRIHTEKHVWYLGNAEYNNGIIVDSSGNVVDGIEESNRKDLIKRIEKYAAGFASAASSGKVDRPSGGDCWFCCGMFDSGNPTHLYDHMEEKYYVPRLLWNALEGSGYQPAFVYDMVLKDKTWCKRTIKKYLLKNLNQ